MIDSFSFGAMVIDGRQYTSDLIIYPGGRIQDRWWRVRGHGLSAGDIAGLIAMDPQVIIVGTGVNGLMKPEMQLKGYLAERGIKFMAGPNDEAVNWFNELYASSGVGACFHLSC